MKSDFSWDLKQNGQLMIVSSVSWNLSGAFAIESRFFSPVFIFKKKIFWIRSEGALLCCDK